MEHLFFRLVLSINGIERIRIAFSFLGVLQPGIKSSCCTLASPACPSRLCLFGKLFFTVGFASVPSFFSMPRFFVYLLRSRFYTVYVWLSVNRHTGFRYWRARKNLYVVQCRRVNEFLCGRDRSSSFRLNPGSRLLLTTAISSYF